MCGRTNLTPDNDKPTPGEWSSDDARYRRPRRPVEVRRRTRWKEALVVSLRVLVVVTVVAAVGGAGYGVYRFASTSPLFRLADPEAIEIADAQQVPLAAVRDRFASDLGNTVFAIPLEERRRSLEEIAWVESATVQRLLPNRVRVYLRERVPVAFLREGHGLALLDRTGVILTPPESSAYDFAVLNGISEAMPPAERQERVQLYLEMVADLDRDGKNYSHQLSEIDLGDPENLRATLPDGDGIVLLHFGRDRYQEKFEAYLQHRPLWQQSGETVRAVDLRYRGQIVLNPQIAGAEGNP